MHIHVKQLQGYFKDRIACGDLAKWEMREETINGVLCISHSKDSLLVRKSAIYISDESRSEWEGNS